MSAYSIPSSYRRTIIPIIITTTTKQGDLSDNYDVVIQFHSAEGLPKLDIVKHINPYFVAKIDDQISYTSTVLFNTSIPRWSNEEWIVRNIPSNAQLFVSIYDKNERKFSDDCIGTFEILNISNYGAPSSGHPIIDSFGRPNGRFHLSIRASRSTNETQQLPRYIFDGPCRYSRHDFSDIIDRNMSDTNSVDSIWKVQMRRIPFFLPLDEDQQQNQRYKSSRTTLDDYPILLAAQNTMKLTHQRIGQGKLKESENGRLMSADDLWKLIFSDKKTRRILPCAYNYIIDDNTWQFSEIGRRWLTDSEVKHNRLANSSERVRYAGEFHLRPKFGWNRLEEEWELVFDNASGTYSPNGNLLANVKNLFLFNFPGLNIITYDYKDPRLTDSMEQLEFAAKMYNRNSITTVSKRAQPYFSSTFGNLNPV